MAVTVVQHKSGHSIASATTVDITMTSTAASALLVVGAASAGNHTVNTVTDNIGNTYTQASGAAASANSAADRTDIWYCLSASSGVTTITITFNGSAGTFVKDGEGWEVSGFATAAFDTANQGTDINLGASNSWLGASVTTAVADEFVAAETKVPAGSTIDLNPDSGNEFTSGGDIASGTDSAGCSLVAASAAAHQPGWHCGNSFILVCASTAAFRQSPGPTITVQPVSQTVLSGATATFNITATGTGTLHYQWTLNGGNVGSDSSSYTTAATINTDNLSTVQCVVTDDNGTFNSDIVTLFVIPTASEWLYKA